MREIRVAYIGVDRFGRATVMVSNEYRDPSRPGWMAGAAHDFIPARDEAEARAIATRLKTSGKVDLIKPL